MQPLPQNHITIPDSNGKKRIVVVGGGFAGINFIKKLKSQDYQIVLIDRNNFHTFQPLLYQVATSGLEPDSIAGPLRKLFKKRKNFFFRMATAHHINQTENKLFTNIGYIEYDFLVLAHGSSTNYFGNEKLAEKAFPMKQLKQALNLRSQVLSSLEKAVLESDPELRKAYMTFAVAGGGPTGVEVAGALSELKRHILPNDYPDLDFNSMEIVLIEGLPRLLAGMSDESGKKSLKYLKQIGVKVKLETLVKDYDGETVELNDGSSLKANTLIWAAGVMGNYLKGLPEAANARGRVLVDQSNLVQGTENIYAIGDLAAMISDKNPKGHPMLAQVAIQQGGLLAKNLERKERNKPQIPFEYNDKGSMATIGRNRAVVDLDKVQFGGTFAWMIWMFVHLIAIIGFRNKVVTFANWVWNYFTYDRGTRLIVRDVEAPHKMKEQQPSLEDVVT